MAEATKNASVIGASFFTLDSADAEARRQAVNLPNSVQRDMVITHCEEVYHRGHVQTALLIGSAETNKPSKGVSGILIPTSSLIYDNDGA